jgi:cell wall-associated NlpC family hydrolase
VPTAWLLDGGARGVAQALVAVLVLLLALLVTAISVPVVIVTSLLPVAGPSSALTPRPPAAVVPTPQSVSPGTSSNSGMSLPPAGATAVEIAQRYLGVRYVFGGTDPSVGLDCSGLVQLVFRQLGIRLPRTAQQQYYATSRVDATQLQAGDLVFFARTYVDPNDWVTHVGIYIGGGLQINAPTEGQVVSIQPVFTGFWGAHFIGGGRVAAD